MMGHRMRAESNRAGSGRRILQSVGFTNLAFGLLVVVVTWSEYPENPAALLGAGLALVGFLAYITARGMTWFVHGRG